MTNFEGETVHLDLSTFSTSTSSTTSNHAANAGAGSSGADEKDANSGRRDGGYLLVLPRYFRGIGLDQELSAFLEFCKILSADVKSLAASSSYASALKPGESIEIIPLHPLMITQKGFPDYARRAPHPAVVFRIAKSA
jgi:hypothetical protein